MLDSKKWGPDLTSALIATADTLGLYDASYLALLQLFDAEITDVGDENPDARRWSGIIEALLVLRVHAGRGADRAEFTFTARPDPSEAKRVLANAWQAELEQYRTALAKSG